MPPPIDPTDLLLRRDLLLPPGPTLLLGLDPATAALLADRFPHADLHAAARDLTAQRALPPRPNLHPLWRPAAIPALPTDPPQPTLAAAVLRLPKGRLLSRRLLAEITLRLRPDGHLFLVGANPEGIHAAASDAADLFGPPTLLGLKKGARLLRFTPDPHVPPPRPTWLTEPGVAPGSFLHYQTAAAAQTLDLLSLPGVFSAAELDPASRLLLETLDPALVPGAALLDLGCGVGPLGIWAALSGAASVDLSDADGLALVSAAANLSRLGLGERTRVLPCDVLTDPPPAAAYDLILCNPPFHQARAVDLSLPAAFITYAQTALRPGGRLLLVANRFLRYEKLAPFIVRAETNRFRVLELRAETTP
jgi:16S rRNA (guanine1207-N2)-methyltransferase